MHRSGPSHREEFASQGYTVFKHVLTKEDIETALPIFDEIITIDTRPPVICGPDLNARRQLNSAEYCEPRLSNYGGLPAVLETVELLLDRPFRLTRSPVPTVTFTGHAGGVPGQSWRGHVDWYNPREPYDEHFVYGIIHFTTICPNGGGFTLVPESHHVVKKHENNPAMVKRMFQQAFHNFPELGPEKEIRAEAGDILYYHPLLVHGASDNQSPTARKVLHTHYLPLFEEPHRSRALDVFPPNFHANHLTAMDARFKVICGLQQ